MLTAGGACHGQSFMAISHSVIYDDDRRQVAFEIEFNQPPALNSTGVNGAQWDSFQFVLDTLPGNNGMGGASPLPWETVVRGEEVHEYALIPLRDHVNGPSSQPGSGGWGPVITLLDFELSGTRLYFEASYEHLQTPDGRFSYILDLYEQGVWTGSFSGTSVPAPAGVLVLLLAFPRRRR
jgi:hypothetical protein